jgi:hypothetical protein
MHLLNNNRKIELVRDVLMSIFNLVFSWIPAPPPPPDPQLFHERRFKFYCTSTQLKDNNIRTPTPFTEHLAKETIFKSPWTAAIQKCPNKNMTVHVFQQFSHLPLHGVNQNGQCHALQLQKYEKNFRKKSKRHQQDIQGPGGRRFMKRKPVIQNFMTLVPLLQYPVRTVQCKAKL